MYINYTAAPLKHGPIYRELHYNGVPMWLTNTF